MRMCFVLTIAFGAVCGCGSDKPTPIINTAAAREIARLGVQTTGPATTIDIALPTQFTDGNYGPKEAACRAASYDLSIAAGMQVAFTGIDITELCGSEPAMIWVVSQGDSVFARSSSMEPRASGKGARFSTGYRLVAGPDIRFFINRAIIPGIVSLSLAYMGPPHGQRTTVLGRNRASLIAPCRRCRDRSTA
jgi:hypothetical protein